MINSFGIGLSALDAFRRGLDLTGENLANASTPGYHRQSLILAPQVLGGAVGQGVSVEMVARAHDQLAEQAVLANQYQGSQVGAELDTYKQLEALFTPGTGSLGNQTSNLFTQIQQLTSSPDSAAQRQTLLFAARSLANQYNQLAASIGRLQTDLGQSIDANVQQVNAYTSQIADLNSQIQSARLIGQPPNELLDQRDQVISNLAGLLDVRTVDQPDGTVNVVAGNATLVVASVSLPLATQTSPAGQVALILQGTPVSLTPSSGALTGQLTAYNQVLPGYQAQLDTMARQLASALDTIHATGLGLNGPQTAALGLRTAASPSAALAGSVPFPVQAGSLYISVNDQSTSQRTLDQVVFDPTTQSLQDLAAAITTATGGQVQGSVTSDNRLQLQAQAGFSFDFAGRPPTSPPNAPGVSSPDTTGVLAALGINTLFAGSGAADLQVNPAILANPALLAASRDGQPGDASNLTRLLGVSSQALFGGGTQTIQDAITTLVSGVGSAVKDRQDQQTALNNLGQNLRLQQQSVSGVDPNEEIANMLNFQRSYQMAAKFIATVNSTMDDLLGILR